MSSALFEQLAAADILELPTLPALHPELESQGRSGSRAARAEAILDGATRWITRPEVHQLFELFRGTPDFRTVPPADWRGRPALEVVRCLWDVCDWRKPGTAWDFRFKAAQAEAMTSDDGSKDGGAMRSKILETGLSAELDEHVLAAAGALGMAMPTRASAGQYDLVIVLGGLRLSPLLRAEWAHAMIEAQGLDVGQVVLLGARRPVQDDEREATDLYAPGAATEYDLMVAGGARLFSDDVANPVVERAVAPPKPFADWIIETFPPRAGGPAVCAVAAPAAAPYEKRPNTEQSIAWLLGRPEFAGAKRALLPTSPIYVPYQQVDALRSLGLPAKVDVEVVGFPPQQTKSLQGLQGPAHYLQELRSMIQATMRMASALGHERPPDD